MIQAGAPLLEIGNPRSLEVEVYVLSVDTAHRSSHGKFVNTEASRQSLSNRHVCPVGSGARVESKQHGVVHAHLA